MILILFAHSLKKVSFNYFLIILKNFILLNFHFLGEIIFNDDECDNFDLAPYENSAKSLILIQNNLPSYMNNCQDEDKLKSILMTKSLSNQNLCSEESAKFPRKRKLSSVESNVDELAMIFNDLGSNEDNKNKV